MVNWRDISFFVTFLAFFLFSLYLRGQGVARPPTAMTPENSQQVQPSAPVESTSKVKKINREIAEKKEVKRETEIGGLDIEPLNQEDLLLFQQKGGK